MDERILGKLEDILKELRGIRKLMTKEPEIVAGRRIKHGTLCPKCHGYGTIDNPDKKSTAASIPCPDCKGTKWLSFPTIVNPGKEVECATCDGSGEIESFRCPMCFGVGTYPDMTMGAPPFEFPENSDVICPACGGEGVIDNPCKRSIFIRDRDHMLKMINEANAMGLP